MTSDRDNRCIVFAGGGTGGHIFPGLAVAEQLSLIRPEVRCVFAVSSRPLDAEIVRGAAAEFTVVPARPMILRPRGFVRFVASWGGAVRTARGMIRSLRERHDEVEVVSMGGFVAAPCCQAASVERCPITLVNLDAVPGRANRWIAGRAGRVFTASSIAPGSLRAGRAASESLSAPIVVPPIVRRDAIAPADAGGCRTLLGLDPHRPTLLVTGASQGAGSINEFVTSFAGVHADRLRAGGWQIVHQTGKGGDDRARAVYDGLGLSAKVFAFFDRMGVLWGAADVAVSRSGAGSVAEAWANATPTVFMPYPHHKDQHQRRNAEHLERAGAALIRDDRIDPGANLASVAPALLELMDHPAARRRMRESYAGLGSADGARIIAERLARS